ncbi:MAG: CDP-diacylglycerol--serine O-phosphatidyltransferase [Gemmatimonadaceae bacterium]|nr:CDP-diacylglycerol--serine O-phosphatidyltransferase [Gemmatimonadaceae bacterium]
MKPLPRPAMRRAVVLIPNGFTLANLFFGIYAMVNAARGDYIAAGWCVILGGVMDALDGRVARATRTGSQFGVELDSLVDAISFGVAPAFIMYFAVLNRDSWAWLVCFAFIACAVMRLARFNVEQGGRAKTHFHGLPSPAAGMTLATYYWFTQTSWYHYVDGWPWHTVLPAVMLTLSFLMISHVLYPAMPRVSMRNVRGIIGAVLLAAAVIAIFVEPLRYAFPILVAYVAFGLLRTIFYGLMERLPTGDPLMDDEDDEEPDEYSIRREIEVVDTPVAERRGRRRDRRSTNFPKPISRPNEESE